jgi:hypothetical protein
VPTLLDGERLTFGKRYAHFHGLMLKFATFIMIMMGFSFYTLETFSNYHVTHDINNEIDNEIVLFMGNMAM